MALIPNRLDYLTTEYTEHLHKVANDPRQRAIELKLSTLQEALGGLRPDEVTILGGFEGHGKSALAQQIAFETACTLATEEGEDRRVVFYHSLEMGRFQLMSRFTIQTLGGQDGLGLHNLMNPETITDTQDRLVNTWLGGVAPFPMILFDSATQSVAQIKEALATFDESKEGKPKLIVIDYLHLLTDCASNDPGAYDNAVRQLKDVARMGQAHVLAIARLNRKMVAGELPNSQHIHGSQGIAYHADNVIFIHRPALLDHTADEAEVNKAKLIVAKARNGPVGVYDLMWDVPHLKYRDPNTYEAERRTHITRPKSPSRFSKN